MKDTFGNELQIGDKLILTVSRGSHYLTSATIIDIDETSNRVNVMYSSTIKTKWIDPKVDTLKYNPKPYVLDGRLGLCRDCVNRVIEPGQKIVYRNLEPGKDNLTFGTIKTVDSDLWVTLENSQKVRNVGIFIL